MFGDREDVEEWLKPLDYEGFWREIEIFALDIQPRESCDAQIANGEIDEATVLFVLKGMARLELIERYALPVRDVMPQHSLH
ncbi:MAG: hypothetical protein KDK08_28525 [Rhizobiaceae bacterium]|nr:hypothetical protein [Rhizobiaceae bacterium]